MLLFKSNNWPAGDIFKILLFSQKPLQNLYWVECTCQLSGGDKETQLALEMTFRRFSQGRAFISRLFSCTGEIHLPLLISLGNAP